MHLACPAGGHDNTVKLWNLDISDFSQNLVGHEGPVTCVSIADDEAFAVSGSEDKTVKVWSIMMGCVITDYMVRAVAGIAGSTGSKFVIYLSLSLCSFPGTKSRQSEKVQRSKVTTCVLKVQSSDCLLFTQEHQTVIEAVYVLPDNTRVLSAEAAGITKLWNAEDGMTYLNVTGPVQLLEVSPNRQLGIAGEAGDQWYDNVIKIRGNRKLRRVRRGLSCEPVVTVERLQRWENSVQDLLQRPTKCCHVLDQKEHMDFKLNSSLT